MRQIFLRHDTKKRSQSTRMEGRKEKRERRKDDHNERLEGEISTEKRNYKMNQMEMEILKLKNRISGLPWWHSG